MLCLLVPLALAGPLQQAAPLLELSGIAPARAVWNEDNEAGIGAVVPWAGRLWFLTYPPHRPRGSADRLWSLRPGELPVAHPASVGGTHAARFIHEASGQLFLGPYAIDTEGRVRVLSPEDLPGRLTGWAPSPWDPESTMLVATMEEGLYAVDAKSLAVRTVFADDQGQLRGEASQGPLAGLPGYHGKGLASGQGVVVYSNNGEPGTAALADPRTPSGCLAEYDGERWTVVRRAQFTEVTGPGGLRGSARDAPLWAAGWDSLSVLLGIREEGAWSFVRLPKGSRTYDGAHGWNTEWPRIRSIGEDDLLMTMHGLMWRFPADLGARSRGGLAPRSAYLKVVADFARWGDAIVLGCDDTARSGFLNKRALHGAIAGPGQSHSNLWTLSPGDLDRLGPILADGAVWEDADLEPGACSEPFLLTDLPLRSLLVHHGSSEPVRFSLEVDPRGTGSWEEHQSWTVAGEAPLFQALSPPGPWVRMRCQGAARSVTVRFACAAPETRGSQPDERFSGLVRRAAEAARGGVLRVRGGGLQTLAVAADRISREGSSSAGFHHLGADLELQAIDDPTAEAWHRDRLGVPAARVTVDAASAVLLDEQGARWRFPLPHEGWTTPDGAPDQRLAREVVTERDLLQVAGTFYELPALNAGGVAGVRPIASHPFWIQDFCGYRGLLVLTGIEASAPASARVRVAPDGGAAVWVGAVDDLWTLGRPRGRGGPWLKTPVAPGSPSDPYLIHGFQRRTLRLSHEAPAARAFTIELDPTGEGGWLPWRRLEVPAGAELEVELPDALCARWLRVSSHEACVATAQVTAR